MVRYFATLLKPGGAVCIAQGCFSDECESIPEPFRDSDGWQADYARYHSARGGARISTRAASSPSTPARSSRMAT